MQTQKSQLIFFIVGIFAFANFLAALAMRRFWNEQPGFKALLFQSPRPMLYISKKRFPDPVTQWGKTQKSSFCTRKI